MAVNPDPTIPEILDSDDVDEPGELDLHRGVLRWVYGLAPTERPGPDGPASER
jgi:hypothetical protein